jgi:diguanylate cyclase
VILRLLVAWLIPPDLTLARWRRTCLIYSLVFGILAGAVDMILDQDFDHWHITQLIIPLTIFLVAFVGIFLAFFLTREVALLMGRRMAAQVDRIVVTGTVREFEETDWPAVEQLSRGLWQLLKPRQLKIAQLQEDVEYYRQLAEGMLGLELVFGLDRRLRWANPGVMALTGFTREECMAAEDPFGLWVYNKDRPMLRDLLERVYQGQTQENMELRIHRKEGALTWCTCRCYLLSDHSGQPSGLRFSAQDIQPRKDADLKLLETVAALRRAQALKEHYLGRSNDERMRMASLLEIVNLGILFIDRDRRVVYVNQVFADMWQLGSRQDVVGMRDDALLAATSPLRLNDENYRGHVADVVSQRSQNARYDIACVGGRVLRERSSAVPASHEGDPPIGRVWIYEDITEALRIETRLVELAERDPLTNLYNRRRFHEDLDRELAESVRHGSHLGLLVFDMDGFKNINDQYGHHAGDEVLCRVASEISGVVRRNELLYRQGGDEFAILTMQIGDGDLSQLAQRVVDKAASLIFSFEGEEIRISISLGIATTLIAGHKAEALIHAADHAMYQAKSSGKNQWIMAARPGMAQQTQQIIPSK